MTRMLKLVYVSETVFGYTRLWHWGGDNDIIRL